MLGPAALCPLGALVAAGVCDRTLSAAAARSFRFSCSWQLALCGSNTPWWPPLAVVLRAQPKPSFADFANLVAGAVGIPAPRLRMAKLSVTKKVSGHRSHCRCAAVYVCVCLLSVSMALSVWKSCWGCSWSRYGVPLFYCLSCGCLWMSVDLLMVTLRTGCLPRGCKNGLLFQTH